MRRLGLIGLLVLGLGACGPGEQATEGEQAEATAPTEDAVQEEVSAAPTTADIIAAALAAPGRPDSDREADAGRRPAEVIEFLGIGPGMTVLDLVASSGYYSEILSAVVGPEGKVYLHNTKMQLTARKGATAAAIEERLADDRLSNVERLDRETDDLGLEPGSVDAVMLSLVFHDVYNFGGEESARALLANILDILKPGGTLALIDHSGNADMQNVKLHRMQESDARRLATDAGFVLEGEGDMLRNPDDDRSVMVFDPSMRRNTDRFVLRFRKP